MYFVESRRALNCVGYFFHKVYIYTSGLYVRDNNGECCNRETTTLFVLYDKWFQ